MSDMLAVIEPKSDQFNADSLLGGEMTVKIESVELRPGAEQPVTVKLAGEDKVFRPCKTVARIMVAAWGADSSSYVGKSMRLYRDADVTWGAMKVGGIRVRAMSHIAQPLVIALTEKKGSKKIATIRPLIAEVAPIGLTIDTARTLIADASDLDALKRVWTRKDMAPFRGDLKADLDDRKAALEFESESRADEDHGEPHPGTLIADELVTAFTAAERPDQLNAAAERFIQHKAAMHDDDATRVSAARQAAADRMGS